MNKAAHPTLAVGLPVYNGERFVGAAIDAMRRQSYEDFQLIISDNASSDDTEAICRAHARCDDRIRYYRNARNIGPAANFNRVFELSSSAFFKWMAHDDLHHPDFLARCMAALARAPDAALAYARAVTIDPAGNVVREPWGAPSGLSASAAPVRFRAALEPPTEPLPLPIFGVARAGILRRTALQCALPGSDLALLAEIALHGRLVEIPEPLFLQREHAARVGPVLAQDPYRAAAFWGKADGARITYPHWRLLRRHVDSIRRAPLSSRDAGACRRAALRLAWRDRGLLFRDMLVARREGARFESALQQADAQLNRWRWQRQTRKLEAMLARELPPAATVVLADDGQLALDPKLPVRILPFIERDGACWGAPTDAAQARRELERAIAGGATHFVVAWPAFWWLDYYREFFADLRAHSVCLADTRLAKVFLLQS
jgi:glycosyltransferase involved in cell wall biosynthesis